MCHFRDLTAKVPLEPMICRQLKVPMVKLVARILHVWDFWNSVISMCRFRAFTAPGCALGLCESATVAYGLLAFEGAYVSTGCPLFAFLKFRGFDLSGPWCCCFLLRFGFRKNGQYT